MIRALATLALCAASATAQTAAAFEVASVRPAAQTGGGRGGRGMGLMGARSASNIHVAPGSLTMRGVTFRTAIRWAYHVADFQGTGPDWIDQQRYDIAAKAAGDADEEQLRLMLQTLLADRFKLVAQKLNKESQAWVLTVAKSGPKLKPSTTEGEGAIQPDIQKMQVGIQRTSIADLIDFLGPLLRAPIVDETGLKGRYDITIDVAKHISDQAAPSDMLSTILTGIQQELGLKLEWRKLALDFVAVEKAERTPVEN